MKTILSSQLFRASALLLAIGAAPLPAQDQAAPADPPARENESAEGEPAVAAEPWTQADTRLANHYIQLLQKDPAYGNVLDLLWDLYAKKEQTPLLLDYFRKASETGNPAATLIHAHLLRKSGELDGARVAYSDALDAIPDSPHALRALAEIADRQKRFGKALSLYTRLAEVVPAATEEGVSLRLRQAALHRSQGQLEEAVATWKELLEAHPADVELRTRIVSQLLEAGETEAALGVLRELAESGDARQRLDAHIELTRLYEFISDFEGAAESARAGLALLHFRNHDYADLFARLVQVYERFERLPDLEASLAEKVDETNPTERSLHDLAEFYRIIADPQEEEKVVARLVERLPDQLDHRIRLTRILMRNDRYDAAAETLETALAGQPDYPLHLLFLRARISLGADSRLEAEEVVTDWLAEREPTDDEVREIIDFARDNYLDDLVERLLRTSREDGATGSDGVSAPVELARFLHERGRRDQAREALENYVAGAEDGSVERARRLHQAAVAWRDLGENEPALESVEKAIAISPENGEFLTTRADLLVDGGEIDEAVAQLEDLWSRGDSYDAKSDIDQRLFSLLRGHYSSVEEPADDSVLKDGNIQTLAQYRRLAEAASRVSRPGDEPPPRELIDYYQRILEEANGSPSTGSRYRAAWWAFKLQDNQECYQQLMRATEEAGGPVLEVEKMLLDLAVQNERPTLMVKHLATLAEIDPDNADDYLQRRAEMRFELGFEDEAVRELRELAAKPEASLNTLKTLAKVYQRQGNMNKQVEVWQRAYRDANVFEKRRIVKQLSTTLIENGNPQAALEAQLELLERESDPVQRRKQLDTQLTVARSHFLLDWLLDRYSDLAQQKPFDRFYPEALARIHQAAGDDREAFEAMKKAYYMSDRSEALLDELGQLADRLGDLESAIYYRRQLLSRGEGASLENWLSLIAMLEKDLRIGEAGLLRRRLESRFGRDPDFLADLTDHYLDNGQFRDAERSLGKLVSLRTWDLESRFRLGLLKGARGRREEALELFGGIVAESGDAEAPADLPETALPLLRLSTLSADDRANPGHELDRFVFTVEGYPFLGGSLQDDIAEALQAPHPEFRWLPGDPYLLRLRAIEEGASLAARLGRTPDWLRSLRGPDVPVIERIWAARHGGDRAGLARLLASLPDPEGHAGLLAAAWGLLLAGDLDGALAWAEPDPVRDEGRHPRSRYLVMAAFLLLKDIPEDPLADEDFLFEVLGEFPLDKEGTHFFQELRKKGDFDAAYRVGLILAADRLEDDGNFLFELSQVAGWAGRREERLRLLGESLDRLVSARASRGNGQFLAALTERLALLENDGEREELVREVLRRSREHLAPDSSKLLEREILVSLADRRTSAAIADLGQLMRRQVDVIRPRTDDLDQLRYNQSQSWQRMNQLLRYYSDRIPVTPENKGALLAALSGDPLAPPSDESVLTEFERFEIDRRLLALETGSAAERDLAVEEIHRSLRDRDSALDLAKSLENRGFYREAIPVYRIEAMNRDRDYAPLQGLFEACNEALEPAPALTVINQINAREFPAPPGLTSEYLAEQHARFLLLSRDIERLLPLSRPPSGGKGAPPITSTAHLPYQAALVEAYRLMGHDDALLRLLSWLRSEDQIDTRQLLLGVRTLRARGEPDTALEWIRSVPLDQSEPNLEREALVETAELIRAVHPGESAELVELARIALEHHPPRLTRHLANFVHDAGATPEAVGILKLLRRKTSNLGELSSLSAQLLRLQRAGGTEWSALAGEWEIFFRHFVYLPNYGEAYGEPAGVPLLDSNAGRLVRWILAEEGGLDELAGVLEPVPKPEGSAWIGDLLVAHARGDLEAGARALLADAEGSGAHERILETLPAFGEPGIVLARAVVEESARPGTDFFPHEPVRQIAFFHRVDRSRLLEVHELLMKEAESDLFHQQGLEKYYPTLISRRKIPASFAAIGEDDLAARLFHRYHRDIGNYRWIHVAFLDDYIRFLIDQSEFDRAETVLKSACRKSLRLDLRLLLELYDSWGKLAEWESRTADLHLTAGRRALLRDWRSALAEGREMVKYSDSW